MSDQKASKSWVEVSDCIKVEIRDDSDLVRRFLQFQVDYAIFPTGPTSTSPDYFVGFFDVRHQDYVRHFFRVQSHEGRLR